MGEFTATRITYLFRRNGSMYYARIKIGGVGYKRSLKTTKLDIARVKLPVVISEIKSAAAGEVVADKSLNTLGGCIASWVEHQRQRPDIKDSTRDYWIRCGEILSQTLPCKQLPAMVGDSVLREWWAATATRFHTTYANNLLTALIAVIDLQVDAGFRKVNPARKLKRVKAIQAIRRMPSPEEFAALIADVRAQNKRFSLESADFMEWVAYSGMRPSELIEMSWQDVGTDRLIVRGGATGTKNRKERIVPLMEALRGIVERRRQDTGPVFHIKTPRIALRNACDRLGMAHLRVYDLRHFFATSCIQSGVHFAHVGKWLGHSDGGALCARVYGHVRDAAGMEEAKKVEF